MAQDVPNDRLSADEVKHPTTQQAISRRRLLKILAASGGAVAASSLLLEKWTRPVVEVGVLPAHAQVSPVPTGTQTFSFTGAQQTFVVPAGVTSVTIEAWGAEGGTGYGTVPPIAGGRGGYVVATIAVTPGETLFVYVGGQGQAGADAAGGVGSFNGGGDGGSSWGFYGGGGGGGASDVRPGGNALAARAVVAGGGGGGGGNYDGSESGGGAGGGTTGAAGADSWPGSGGGGGSSYTVPGATNVTHAQGVRAGDGQVIISW